MKNIIEGDDEVTFLSNQDHHSEDVIADLQYVNHMQIVIETKSLTATSPLRLFDLAKTQNRPLYASAPMVRYSKVHLSFIYVQLD